VSDIQRLRNDLAPYFISYDAARFLGRVSAFPATADIPGGLQTDDWCIRTDLDLICNYDGARWLSQAILSVNIPRQILAANDGIILAPLRQDFAPYIIRVTTEYSAAATNNGTNFWTITYRGINAAYAAASNIHSFTTAALTAGTYASDDGAPSVTATPTNRAFIELQCLKTLAPGNLTIAGTVQYRLIIP
jgi:hypothetical protein